MCFHMLKKKKPLQTEQNLNSSPVFICLFIPKQWLWVLIVLWLLPDRLLGCWCRASGKWLHDGTTHNPPVAFIFVLHEKSTRHPTSAFQTSQWRWALVKVKHFWFFVTSYYSYNINVICMLQSWQYEDNKYGFCIFCLQSGCFNIKMYAK